MAYSRCPMLTQSAPSLAAFRAAWFTTVLMSAPKTVQKQNIYLENRALLKNYSTNCSKTEHYLEITNNTICRNA